MEYAVPEREHALVRMILIDSYAPGRITEVPLDDGVVFTGRNGRGKTSILQIIPLFHGESPSRLSSKSEGRQSFARHYLPNSTSYVIFEYLRGAGEHRLAVVYPYRDDQLAWRFVRSKYSIELFVDDRDHIVEGRYLKSHLQQLGIEASTQILSQTEYRNILHNTPGKSIEQRGYAADYSIMPRGSRMKGVERIVSGMFTKQTNFSDLQNIIVADLREGDESVPLMADRMQAEEWIRDHAAYTDVMKKEAVYQSAEQAGQSKRVARKSMDEAAGRLQDYLQYNAERRRSIEMRRNEICTLEDKIDNEDEPKLRTLNREIGEKEDELSNLEGKSREFEEKQAQYNDQKVSELPQRLMELPAAEQRYRLAEERVQALIGTDEEVRKKHQAMLRSIDAEENQARHAIENEKSAAIDDISAERDHIQERERTEVDAINEQGRLKRNSKTEAREKARKANYELQGNLKLVRAEAAIEDAVKIASQQHEVYKAEYELAFRAQANANLRYLEAKSRHEQSERDLGNAERLKFEAHQDREDAKEFVKGRKGSLLRLLREQNPALVDQMSRILAPEALLSPNLGAAYVEQAESIYGYQINHDLLSPHISADPKTAAEQVYVKELLYKTAEGSAHEAENENKQRATDLIDSRKALNDADYALNQAKVAEERAQNLLAAETLRCNEARAVVKVALEEQAHVASDLDISITREIDAIDADVAVQIAKLRTALKSALSTLSARQNEIKNSADKQITRARCDAQARRVDAQAVLDQDLQSQGVNPADIDEARTARDLALSDLDVMKECQLIYDEYKRWYDRETLPHSKRRIAISNLIPAIDALKASRDILSSEIYNERVSLSDEKSSLRREEEALNQPKAQAITRLSGLTNFLNYTPKGTGSWGAIDELHIVIEQANKAETQSRKANDDLRKAVNDLDAAFSAHPGSQVHQFRSSIRFTGESDGGDALKGYAAWYGHIHHDTRRTMAAIGRQIAQAIGDFYQQLKTFEKNTQQFNRELQKHLGEATNFDGVTELEIRVVSMVSELDYWKRIETVADLAAEWRKHENENTQYEAAFVEALGSLLEMWRVSGSLRADLQQLIRIEGNVTENNQRKNFRNAASLTAISSNGLSYLILVSIFIAFLNRIRRGAPVTITWSLDELRDIDRTNTRVLMNLLKRNRIELVTAFPDPDPDIMTMFRHRFMVGENRNLLRVKEKMLREFTQASSQNETSTTIMDMQETIPPAYANGELHVP